MKLVLILIFFLAVYGYQEISKCDLDTTRLDENEMPRDTAMVRGIVKNYDQNNISLWGISSNCYKCLLFPLIVGIKDTNSDYVQVDTAHGFTMEIRNSLNNQILLHFSHHFGEYGKYTLEITLSGTESAQVNYVIDKNPVDSFIPIYIAIAVYFSLAIIWIGIMKGYQYYKNRQEGSLTVNTGDGDISEESISKAPSLIPKKPNRVRALDAFRGISLAVMIFVNYGGGGYWFFDHSTWNGLTWADLVFPWFIFIMGTAIPLAFDGLLKKGASKKELLKKIIRRSIILFGLGLFLNNGYEIKLWRIPGVLQRFGIAYFVVCIIVLFIPERQSSQAYRASEEENLLGSGRKGSSKGKIEDILNDIIPYVYQWIVIFSFLIIWLCFTFLLPVPGCPTGYLGPGGIGDEGKASNCTGGAAGYIDRVILGWNHIYPQPTCKYVYMTTSYDPEGILGNLTSITLCFLGVQSGRVLLKHKDHKHRIIRWFVWGIILGLLGLILCFGKQDGGPIPLNKNMWSLSFIFVMSGTGNLVLLVCYFFIDVQDWWNGSPFVYLGMNSILMYCGHEVLNSFFPFSWAANDSHMAQLAQNLVGVSMWLLISYYAYLQNFFIAI